MAPFTLRVRRSSELALLYGWLDSRLAELRRSIQRYPRPGSDGFAVVPGAESIGNATGRAYLAGRPTGIVISRMYCSEGRRMPGPDNSGCLSATTARGCHDGVS